MLYFLLLNYWNCQAIISDTHIYYIYIYMYSYALQIISIYIFGAIRNPLYHSCPLHAPLSPNTTEGILGSFPSFCGVYMYGGNIFWTLLRATEAREFFSLCIIVYVRDLRWRSIISKLEKSLNSIIVRGNVSGDFWPNRLGSTFQFL